MSASTLVFQVVGAILDGAQLYVGRELLTKVIGSEPITVSAVLPWGFAFVGILTPLALVGPVRKEIQRILAESVAREAQSTVVRAASTADLIDFDRPHFHNRLQRVLDRAHRMPRCCSSNFPIRERWSA